MNKYTKAKIARPRSGRRPKKCPGCDQPKKDITWGADPFNHDVYGDETPIWLCGDCRYQRAMDV